MIADAAIMDVIRRHRLAYCEPHVLPGGNFRVDIRPLYPDGSGITLFVERSDPAKSQGLVISDFGATFAKLAEYHVDPWLPPSCTKTIRDIVEPLGVRVMRDRLVVALDGIDDLHDGIIALSQACVRSSRLIFGRRPATVLSLAS